MATHLLDQAALNKLKRLELQKIAKYYRLASFGTNKDIIRRLLDVYPDGVQAPRDDVELVRRSRRNDTDQDDQAAVGEADLPETSVVENSISQFVPSWSKRSNNLDSAADSGAVAQPLPSATPLPALPRLATPPQDQDAATLFSPSKAVWLGSRSPDLEALTTTLRPESRLPFPITRPAQGPSRFMGHHGSVQLPEQGRLSAGVPAEAAPRDRRDTGIRTVDPRRRAQAQQGMLRRDTNDTQSLMPPLPEGRGPSMPSFTPLDEEVAAAAQYSSSDGSGAHGKHGANDNSDGNDKDAGKNMSAAGNWKNKHNKREDADRRDYLGTTAGFVLYDKRDVDPHVPVDKEDQRLEALENEARTAASGQLVAAQPAPESTSDKDNARVVKGCTGKEMPRIVYSTHTLAEKLAQITQMRLEMARDIAHLQSGTQKVKEAEMMMVAKRLVLEQTINNSRRRARRHRCDEDDGQANGSKGDQAEEYQAEEGDDNCDDHREGEKEHGQEDSSIVAPKTQVLLSNASRQHTAKMIPPHMQKMRRSFSEKDLEAVGHAREASHSDSNMPGPSTSARVPRSPGFPPAWDSETARGVREESPRKSSSEPSSSPGVPAPSSRLSRPLQAHPVTPQPRVTAPKRLNWGGLQARLLPGGVVGVPGIQHMRSVGRDSTPGQVPHTGVSCRCEQYPDAIMEEASTSSGSRVESELPEYPPYEVPGYDARLASRPHEQMQEGEAVHYHYFADPSAGPYAAYQ